ncbi:hypothetical protein R3W88_027116 [Solanum pinnatisectum]|uniref:Uncharacterized protein n=1 Tax=Solanum pinnatisectum TaxID=50273 RepID=A0AAV9LGC0_9SOLN|nr:hypothetical protein R3W88_027116 [Solanum pinnatisectum]
MAPSRFVAPRVSASAAMSNAKQKSFERFVRLVPPRHMGGGCLTSLISFIEWSKEWYKLVLSCRPVASSFLGWEQFTKVFIK